MREMSIMPPSEWADSLRTLGNVSPAWLQGPDSDIWQFGLPAVKFDPTDLSLITEKFVRGVYWALHGRNALPVGIPVATPVTTENRVEAARAIITQNNMTRHGAPGFWVWHGHQGGQKPDVLSTITLILVWGRILLSGFTGAAAVAADESEPRGE